MDRDLLANRRACDSDRSAIERAAKRPRRAHTAHHRRMEDIVDISMDSAEAHTRAKESQAHSGSDSRPSSRMRNADFRALWGESGPGPSQPGPSSSEEPIRWNRVRRRSSSRTVRPAVETAPDEDEVTIYPPAEEPRVEDIDDFNVCSQPTAFDPLSLASFATRRPPSLPSAYQGSAQPSRWAVAPAPPPPCSHDAPPTTLDRTVAPAMYHHLPYRMRHHRPYEPFDTSLHHHSTRSNAHQEHLRPDRQEPGSEPVHRRTTREAGHQALEGLPPPVLPRRHFRRVPTNEELAERIAERRRREEARDASFNARAAEEAELRFRMEELEALEAAFVGLDGPPGPPLPPPPAEYRNWRSGAPDVDVPRPRPEVRGRRRGWGPGSLAEAMMGMLGEDALGPAGARMPHPPPHIAGHLSAMRAAFAGMSSGRLPPHLLFSDRDFNEDDYEALLALDDTVENRKETGDRRCPICLEDYVSGATLRRLHCSHQFHKPCLDKWLQQKATCPICQGECKSCMS